MKTTIVLLLCLSQSALAADVALGRLFFTPAQRAQRDGQHLPTTVKVNGMVQRDGGVRTVWINGIAQRAAVHILPLSASNPPVAPQAGNTPRAIVIQKHGK